MTGYISKTQSDQKKFPLGEYPHVLALWVVYFMFSLSLNLRLTPSLLLFQAYQKGASPKCHVLPAGGKVLTSEEDYNLLSDKHFPDPVGKPCSVLTQTSSAQAFRPDLKMGYQKIRTAWFLCPNTAPGWTHTKDAISSYLEKCWLLFFPASRHKAAGSCAEAGQEPHHHCSQALWIFLVYLFPFLGASCLCWLTVDGKSHREGRKVAAAQFVVSGMRTAVVLPALTPLHENGENLGYKGVNLMFQSQIWKMGCHMRKGIRATCKQGFSF